MGWARERKERKRFEGEAEENMEEMKSGKGGGEVVAAV